MREVEGNTEIGTVEAGGQGRNGVEVPAELREVFQFFSKLLSGGGKVVKSLKMKTRIYA